MEYITSTFFSRQTNCSGVGATVFIQSDWQSEGLDNAALSLFFNNAAYSMFQVGHFTAIVMECTVVIINVSYLNSDSHDKQSNFKKQEQKGIF